MLMSDIESVLSEANGQMTHNKLYTVLYVTRSDKKGLIAHDRKSNIFTQIQSYMNALLDFSVRHGL